MTQVTTNTYDEFERITSVSIHDFFNNFLNFMDNDYKNIINFYRGENSLVDRNFKNFEKLQKERNIVKIAFRDYSETLTNYKFWELQDMFYSVSSQIDTANKINKWLRSSIAKGVFTDKIQIDYTLGQKETLEDVARKVVLSDNFRNDWQKIAINNDLLEEDYTTEGGTVIKVNFDNANLFNINTVVDTIDTGEKTYGLDIQRKLEYSNNDLKVLDYKDTFNQTVEILLNLHKNDNPYSPADGIQQDIGVGSNIRGLTLPMIIRQIVSTFRGDDSIRSIQFTKINLIEDILQMEVIVESRFDEVVQISIDF